MPHVASCSSLSRAIFSCCSLRAVAWCIDSSDTVAIIRLVVSRMRPWNSFTYR